MDKTCKDIVVIDDDEAFRTLMVEVLRSKDFRVDGYGSIVEMGSFACMKFYRLVLLDYRLEHLNGLEIAEYVDLFFPDTPILLTSAFAQVATAKARTTWPGCIHGFISKSEGAANIASACETIIRQQAAAKSLEWKTKTKTNAMFFSGVPGDTHVTSVAE